MRKRTGVHRGVGGKINLEQIAVSFVFHFLFLGCIEGSGGEQECEAWVAVQ